jgi:ABC-type phosphate transport system permease subunit
MENKKQTQQKPNKKKKKKGNLIKNVLLTLIINILITMFLGWKAYTYGHELAFEYIISERCWLNTQTRDVDCIKYMAK